MKKNLISLLAFGIVACSSPKVNEELPPFGFTGSIERLDPALNSLIPEGSKIEVLASGFEWAEGPLWLEEEQALLFTDVPANKVWKWTESDSLSLYLEPSGYLGERSDKREPGANGLALDLNGNLILCQHGERQVARMNSSLQNPKAEFEILVGEYEGKKFNSPNDLVFNTKGELYFTDPPYGLDEWDEKELDFQGVYKIGLDGSLSLQIDSLSRPNGIGLSPDERTLYIGQSDPEKARYYAFDLDDNGNVISGRILLDVTNLVGGENKGLPDGLKVDQAGNLFATGPGGVLVISPEGKHLGTIRTGEGTANCAFDKEEKYLYMTADMYLMRLALK
ncbi:SMP-30/gluconolactonase/LRE family protein [Algoriphagus sp. CAU 1675]|uniref:SMP-30/gluconolactonase/LRE family protein n=1 Tax=Algoriphagus sp. CAU 1675 TaxID=3032597 RepID=UPI0023DC6143|nr:SMP-30/gluconolactonase/LRE family protein [Algoriphagus sp. CAU 1675]MDF2159162.1 SMP-30/gluconolactonase/LRE family protein [Algoriphagus sp. CAU 1675]